MPVVNVAGETRLVNRGKFSSTQSPGSVLGDGTRTVLLGDVDEDHRLGLATGSFKPVMAHFTQGFVNANFDNQTGALPTYLPQTNVGLSLAGNKRIIKGDAGRRLADVLIAIFNLVDFICPPLKPALEDRKDPLIQGMRGSFDHNTFGMRVVFNVADIGVVKAPDGKFSHGNWELGDGNTPLKFIE